MRIKRCPVSQHLFLFIALILSGCTRTDTAQPTSTTPLYADSSLAEQGEQPAGTVKLDYSAWSGLVKPPLPPDEALARFHLEEGFEVELVASEPDVVDPVAMDIDRDGNFWVAEMISYMPVWDRSDAETSVRERVPQGRIVVLSDSDADGRVDRRRVFADELILPRAIKVLDRGVLIAEPPRLWYYQDTTGDGIADKKEVISDRYGDPDVANVEHMPNGLLWAMDNWIHSADQGAVSVRPEENGWKVREIEALPQWGISQDDWGRLIASQNSRAITSHLVPYGYSGRHPDVQVTEGIYESLAESEIVWPPFATGVNRGYRVGIQVREDGTLLRMTAASGAHAYRGDQFGENFYGDIFVGEPAANLVRRYTGLNEDPAAIDETALHPYEGREFLTTPDERFRPVNLYTGPDGALYIIDMYRGIFQHARYLTDHLRDYAVEHDLHLPSGPGQFGRIWRVVRSDRPIRRERVRMSERNPSEWSELLVHANGFYRDRAQQLLVERSPASEISTLEAYTTSDELEPTHRLQALWTLEGYDRAIYPASKLRMTALEALGDPHPRVRAAAIRILEPAVQEGDEDVTEALFRLVESERAPYTQLQLLATLGAAHGEELRLARMEILQQHPDDLRFHEMALTGVAGEEAAWLDLLREWFDPAEQIEKSENEDVDPRWATLYRPILERISQTTGEQLATDDRRMREGARLWPTCQACHGSNGEGMAGAAPALVGSDWVNGSPEALIRIVLDGFSGGEWSRSEGSGNVMPAHRYLGDEEVAHLLTWMRQSWGHRAEPVSPEQVREVRVATEGRSREWTPEELTP
ncbi:MAG: c-type cytochrome [Balneolaceae bacterium]